jgi:hypothetical protein
MPTRDPFDGRRAGRKVNEFREYGVFGKDRAYGDPSANRTGLRARKYGQDPASETRPFQYLLGRIGHIAPVVILALEVNDVLQRIESHDRDELDLVAQIAPEQFYASVAWYSFVLNSAEYFALEQVLVCIGIFWRGPPVPHTLDGHGNPPQRPEINKTL